VVLVTHAHFEPTATRQSLRTIARQTRRQTGTGTHAGVPASRFRSGLGIWAFEEIVELEWWNSLPPRHARHYTRSLAALGSAHHQGFAPRLRGYVLRKQAANTPSIHAGDTAYFDGFRELDAAYRPNWRCCRSAPTIPRAPQRATPVLPDATKAFLDLKSRWMIPMHYGTFRLSHEPIEEPLQLLEREAKAAGVKDRVVRPRRGVTRLVLKPSHVNPCGLKVQSGARSSIQTWALLEVDQNAPLQPNTAPW